MAIQFKKPVFKSTNHHNKSWVDQPRKERSTGDLDGTHFVFDETMFTLNEVYNGDYNYDRNLTK